MRVPSNLQITN